MKTFLRLLTIKTKLRLILIVSVLALVLIQAASLNELWNDLNNNKKHELQNITLVAHSIMVGQDKLVQNGAQTLEQAQENAKNIIANLTYGNNEYFFIFDKQYKMVMHPIKPKLNGVNLKPMADTDGTLFFDTMITEAVRNGESFVNYVWPRAGSSESVDKLSYSKYYNNWGWAVATGVYIDDIVATFHQEVWVASRTTLIVLIITFTLVYFVSNSITTPLQVLEQKINQISSEKNLTIRANIRGKDELADIGRAFDGMIDNFGAILSNMNIASEQMSASSAQLSSTTEQTLVGMESQKSETQQVASAMTQMSATVQEVAINISDAASASHIAAQASETGKAVVLASRRSIEQLSSKLENAEVLIHTLEQQSNDISSILSVITGIAEQTNLLALNAAIEAARAGEQGRGFAVVADEVRSLSSRTHESTNEINEVIIRLQAGSQAAVAAMNDSKQAAQNVFEQATNTENALADITESVAKIDSMTSQIASASEQQTIVAEEINKNITTISSISEESAVGAHQTAQASEDLAKLSVDLKAVVQQFIIQSAYSPA